MNRLYRLRSVTAVALFTCCCGISWAQSPPPSGPGGQAAPAPPPSEKYPPAANLEEALQLALDAVRQAEDESNSEEVRQEKVSECAHYTTAAADFDRDNLKAEYINGRLNILINRDRDAFSQIRKYVESPVGEGDAEAWRILGGLFLDGGYPPMAEAKYRRALKLNPADPLIYLGLAKASNLQSRFQEGAGHVQRAIRLDPSSSEAYQVLATAMVGLKDYREAKRAMREAVARSRGKVSTDTTNTVELTRLLGYYRQSLAVLRSLIVEAPKDPDKFAEFGQDVLDYSQVTQLQLDVERVLAIHALVDQIRWALEETNSQVQPTLVYECARLCMLAGRSDDAVEALEGLLAIDPQDATAIQMLEDIKSGVAQAATPLAVPSAPPADPGTPPAGTEPEEP